MVRRGSGGTGIGVLVTVLGVGLMTASVIGGDESVVVIGCLTTVIGFTLACYQQLAQRLGDQHREVLKMLTASDDRLHVGYDLGFEAGWRDRDQTARPVVVDLAARRCSCQAGKSKALTPAGRVAKSD